MLNDETQKEIQSAARAVAKLAATIGRNLPHLVALHALVLSGRSPQEAEVAVDWVKKDYR